MRRIFFRIRDTPVSAVILFLAVNLENRSLYNHKKFKIFFSLPAKNLAKKSSCWEGQLGHRKKALLDLKVGKMAWLWRNILQNGKWLYLEFLYQNRNLFDWLRLTWKLEFQNWKNHSRRNRKTSILTWQEVA